MCTSAHYRKHWPELYYLSSNVWVNTLILSSVNQYVLNQVSVHTSATDVRGRSRREEICVHTTRTSTTWNCRVPTRAVRLPCRRKRKPWPRQRGTATRTHVWIRWSLLLRWYPKMAFQHFRIAIWMLLECIWQAKRKSDRMRMN